MECPRSSYVTHFSYYMFSTTFIITAILSLDELQLTFTIYLFKSFWMHVAYQQQMHWNYGCSLDVLILKSFSDFIIARQHTDARYWYSNLSVHLSVHNAPVSDENGSTYCHSFSPYGSTVILVLPASKFSQNSDKVTPCRGAKYRWGIKILWFSTKRRCISQTIQDSAIVTIEGK